MTRGGLHGRGGGGGRRGVGGGGGVDGGERAGGHGCMIWESGRGWGQAG
jgi:hypothetical protein